MCKIVILSWNLALNRRLLISYDRNKSGTGVFCIDFWNEETGDFCIDFTKFSNYCESSKKFPKFLDLGWKIKFLKIHFLSKISLFRAVPGCFLEKISKKLSNWGFLGDKNLLILKFKKYQKLASKTRNKNLKFHKNPAFRRIFVNFCCFEVLFWYFFDN